MTEKEVVVRYIRFCRQGRIPRVLYNAATKDLLIYSVADPRSSLNEEAEKKGYADISQNVMNNHTSFAASSLYERHFSLFLPHI